MISPSFAAVLAAGRAGYNDRMREARRRHPALAQDVFANFLATRVGPLVDAAPPGRTAAVADACYDVALELVGRALVGPAAKNGALEQAWLRAIPRFAALLASDPVAVLGLLNNALLHLASIPGARSEQWIDEMAAAAPSVGTLGQLRALGVVAAWRAGAAHFRDGALAACVDLPPGLGPQMSSDPWWHGPDAYARDQRVIGAFTGFGGPFRAPPEVRPLGAGFVVRAAGDYFYLLADAYGAVLRTGDADAFALASAGGHECANDTTVAVTSPVTHAIHLKARR